MILNIPHAVRHVLATALVALAVLASTTSSARADIAFVSGDGQHVVLRGSDATDPSARREAAQSIGCNIQLGRGGQLTGDCRSFPLDPGQSWEEYQEQEQISETGQARTAALVLFDYSMGSSGSCLSCNFMSFFMIALTDFSWLIFDYFIEFFVNLVPLCLLVWLGYRTAKLMITGGEDGRDFIMGVSAKLALFVMVWLFATATGESERDYAWYVAGPVFLEKSFTLSNDIRTRSLGATTGEADSTITCDRIEAVNTEVISRTDSSPERYKFLDPAVKSACFTERAHALGIASGAALAFDSYHSAAGLWSGIAGFFDNAFSFIFKLLIGLFVSIVYAISAIWLIFLVLDIVTRALMTAAFSPVLLGLYLFQPTRGIPTQAFKALLGSMVTAVALSVINVLAFVLITNTAQVYNVTKDQVVEQYESWSEDEAPVLDLNDRKGAMRDFVRYVGEGSPDAERIEMDFGTPWFWYMAFSGVAIFALGKKIIKMLEDTVGYSGASEFANSALKSVKMGAVGAMVGTGATAAVASAGMGVAGRGLGYAGGYGGAMAGGGLGKAMQGLGGGMQWVNKQANPKNVFSTFAMGAEKTARHSHQDP